MKKSPTQGCHVGEIISEWIDENGWTQREFAEAAGYSEKHISRIVNGHVPLSAGMALDIQTVTGMPADLLARIDANYRVQEARRCRRL